MADVRLTATNPEDSSVVPVACNAKGELLLEEPQVPEFDGNVDGDLTVTGSAAFTGGIDTTQYIVASRGVSDNSYVLGLFGNANGVKTFIKGDGIFIGDSLAGINSAVTNANISLNADGSAAFTGDVVIGSRNKQWMIVESNGLAHLVEQTRAAEMRDTTEYPPLRDIPGELTMVEQQLQKVLEKLRMIPEAGWEVWDGSDTN